MSQWDEEAHASQEVKLAFMQAVFDFLSVSTTPKKPAFGYKSLLSFPAVVLAIQWTASRL
jgi:hypothetical protein